MFKKKTQFMTSPKTLAKLSFTFAMTHYWIVSGGDQLNMAYWSLKSNANLQRVDNPGVGL